MRIAIVNNMSTAVVAMRRILLTIPDYKLAWIARNAAEAVAKCAQDTPDLILMDLLMPVRDGLNATKQIMINSPCGILIVTTNIDKNVAQVYEAMGYGALDVVNTPVLNTPESEEMATALLAKIAKIRKLLKTSSKGTKTKLLARQTLDSSSKQSTGVHLVAIGSSTGGPKALATILSQLPANFDKAIAIVQHVDAQFSNSFVEWLSQQTVLPVRAAVGGDYPKKGTVLVAGNNDHLYLKPNLTFDYTKNPVDYPYRPSVDVFFNSLAQHWKSQGTAILLTGMGRDGAEGLSTLRLQGWNTIAQDRESCIVFGMPKAAIELKAAVKVLPLNAIATELLNKTFYPI